MVKNSVYYQVLKKCFFFFPSTTNSPTRVWFKMDRERVKVYLSVCVCVCVCVCERERENNVLFMDKQKKQL